MSAPEDGRSRAPAASDLRATLREMWETRPARRRDDRKVLGVAAAIARRYAVDPTLVRVVIVVAAFYGVGILAYVVGWLVLPTMGPDGRRHASSGWAIAAAVLVGLVAVGSVLGPDAGALVGLLVLAGLLYALHQSRGRAVADGAAPAVSSGPGATDSPAGSAGSVAGDGSARPPSWDPLGAAPFAWDLPEPSAPPPPKEPRSWLTPATLAVALLVAGIVLALGLVGLVPLGTTPVVGAALLVVGAGLLVGAFRGGDRRGANGRGLLVAAVPLALVLVAAASDGPDRFGDGRFGPGGPQGVGDAEWAPTAQVAPLYETSVGDATLDLRSLRDGPPVIPPASTTVRSGTGDVTVLVPELADVSVDCTSGAGTVDCLDRGPGRHTDLGPDGPGGAVIDLRAVSGAGDVEVRRG